jgi:hypothetical protein
VARPGWRLRRISPGNAVTRVLLVWFLVAGPVLFASCGSAGKAADSPGSFVKSQNGITATLTVDPYPPRPMQKASFSLTLADAKGDPLTGVSVVFDMTMPAMPMPVNRPEAAETKPGTYTADVLFTMAGEWQAAAELALAGGRAETLTFAMSTR